MLRVRSTSPRDSKLWPKVVEVCKQRNLKNIGILQLEPESKDLWTCHKCDGKFPVPPMPDGDVLQDCPGCKYPFLMINCKTTSALHVDTIPSEDDDEL